MEKGEHSWQIPWRLFLSELVGTAVLLLGGLSIVIFMFGAGSPMERLLPSVKIRQMTTGFLFGCVGTLITLSNVGKESGAHINPGRHSRILDVPKARYKDCSGLRHRAVGRRRLWAVCHSWPGARWAEAWPSAPPHQAKATRLRPS